MGRRMGLWIFVGIVLALAAGGMIWKNEHRSVGLPTKNDSSPRTARVVAEGRLVPCPDAEVLLRSEHAGVIERYPAREHESVRKGDLLASLNAEEVEARLERTMAILKVADSRLGFAAKQYRRAKRLLHARTMSYASYDRARKKYDMANAWKEQSEASVRLYRAILAKTRILSPIDGVVVARYHNQGEYVGVGARIVTVADLSRTRIEAEVDEFDAGRVRIAAPVRIRAEGDRREWEGIVDRISERVTRKHLVPDDPSRPTDTGVVRIKIAPLVHLPFKLGQKVTVSIGRKTALSQSASLRSRIVSVCRGPHG